MKTLKKTLKASLPIALSLATATQCSLAAFAQETETEPTQEEVIQQEVVQEEQPTEESSLLAEDVVDEEVIVEEEVNNAPTAIINRWVQLGDQWYHYNEKGEMDTNKWIQTNGKWYYVDENGIMVVNKEKEINGKTYRFDADGVQVVGWYYNTEFMPVLQSIGWHYYYSNGGYATDFATINGKTYYFGDIDGTSGSIGLMKTGAASIKTKIYYFDENGVMQKSKWQKCTLLNLWEGKENWIYLQDNGQAVQSSWKKLDGKWYYFDELGRMVKDTIKEIDGKEYKFTESGALVVGWYYEKDSGAVYDHRGWYYYYSDGSYAKDFATINNKTYYFGVPDGMTGGPGFMKTGAWFIKGKIYYFDENGVMQKSKWQKCTLLNLWEGKENWIYLQDNGQAVKSAWKKLDGKWYYFDELGRMVKDTTKEIDGKYYTFAESGAMCVGWLGSGKYWSYIHEDGTYADSFEKINGKTYYFGWEDLGKGAYTGISFMRTGAITVEGNLYYFAENGVMQTNKWVKTDYRQWADGENWIYLQSNGHAVKSAWKKLDGKWYYFDELGRMVHDKTLTIDGKKYTFNSNGVWVK